MHPTTPKRAVKNYVYTVPSSSTGGLYPNDKEIAKAIDGHVHAHSQLTLSC